MEVDRRRLIGAYTFLAFFVVWFAVIFTVNIVQSQQNGRGLGIGDTPLQPSLRTPGGPYYPSGR